MKNKRTGFSDGPIEDFANDLFDVKKYVNALSDFIRECNTPMTIAIQGDWGSGKTSFMNMIKSDIQKDVIPIWFNTWQFSQFNMEGDIPVTFLQYLVDEVEEKCPAGTTGEELKKHIKTLGLLGAKAVGIAANIASGGAESLNNYIEEYQKVNPIELFARLKTNFQEAVDKICREMQTDRMVFFIDDLDRLQPVRAVELLEVLKLFLDCEKCVFVLAIDYEVISQGIRKKYEGSLDAKKSRKFFEKIIQVPFKMPVAHYNIDNYIKESLREIGIDNKENVEYESIYIQLIQNSIGYNPRTMKRAFNVFLLLSKVQENEKQKMDALEKLCLFGCLCLQLSYEKVYNFVISHLDEDEENEDAIVINQDFFAAFENDGLESFGEDFFAEIEKDKDYENRQLEDFLRVFFSIFSDQSEEQESGSVFEKLQNVLRMTSVTATGNDMVERKNQRREKLLDEEPLQRTIAEVVDNLKADSTNSCKILSCCFGNQNYEKEGKAIKMTEVLVKAVEYAYAQDPEMFKKFVTELEGEKQGLHTFFYSNRQSVRPILDGNYQIDIGYNNDQKIKFIYQIFERLQIDMKDVKLTLKYARDK